jgi:hypothetical protein
MFSNIKKAVAKRMSKKVVPETPKAKLEAKVAEAPPPPKPKEKTTCWCKTKVESGDMKVEVEQSINGQGQILPKGSCPYQTTTLIGAKQI